MQRNAKDLKSAYPPRDLTSFKQLETEIYLFLKANQLSVHQTVYPFFFLLGSLIVVMSLWFLAFYRGLFVPAILYGFASCIVLFKTTHPAIHGGYSSQKYIRHCAAKYINLFFGISDMVWAKGHLQHHRMTNSLQDSDLSQAPILKFHSDNKYKIWYAYQPFYCWLLYAFYLPKAMVSNLYKLLFEPFSGRSKLVSLLLIAIHLFCCYILPIVWHGWLMGLALILCVTVVQSYTILGFFVVNHVVTKVETFSADNVPTDWLHHQLAATCNWSTDSKWCNWLSGGLNHQIEHHLFPNFDESLYPRIAPVVRSYCQKNNIPYRETTTYLEALKLHFAYLSKLRQPTHLEE